MMISKDKLTLVLDLDHTLLHTVALRSLSCDKEYCRQRRGDNPAAVTIFKQPSLRRITKLRPFVRTFLREASTMYKMFIFTMGGSSYAREMARLLDPDKVYFDKGRVFSRSDCVVKDEKQLDIIPVDKSTIVILDDTEMVWRSHTANLIQMERYHYFSSGCNEQFPRTNPHHSLAALKTDESEEHGALATILKVLKRVHAMFYDKSSPDIPGDRDVRAILRMLHREVLPGCHIVCSQMFPMYGVWKKCLELGATCYEETDAAATHVVCKDAGTERARWALENGKLLVSRQWVERSYCLWRRMPEEDFPLVNAEGQQLN